MIDGCRIARLAELLGSASQRNDVAPDDADADVVKVIVHKVRCVPRFLGQRMAFIAAITRVEELAAHDYPLSESREVVTPGR